MGCIKIESVTHSALSDFLWPCGLQPTRLLCPWDSPAKNTGVGCHVLLQGNRWTWESNPVSCITGEFFYRLGEARGLNTTACFREPSWRRWGKHSFQTARYLGLLEGFPSVAARSHSAFFTAYPLMQIDTSEAASDIDVDSFMQHLQLCWFNKPGKQKLLAGSFLLLPPPLCLWNTQEEWVINTVKSCVCLGAPSCLTLCDPVDCSAPGSSVHGILQARILEWVAMPSSRVSSPLRGQTQVSYIGRQVLYSRATCEALVKPAHFSKTDPFTLHSVIRWSCLPRVHSSSWPWWSQVAFFANMNRNSFCKAISLWITLCLVGSEFCRNPNPHLQWPLDLAGSSWFPRSRLPASLLLLRL